MIELEDEEKRQEVVEKVKKVWECIKRIINKVIERVKKIVNYFIICINQGKNNKVARLFYIMKRTKSKRVKLKLRKRLMIEILNN